MERRDFLQQIDCFVCNQQEAGILFSDDYNHLSPAQMREVLAANVHSANIPCMVVTMGGQGAVYARANGECGVVPAKKVDVIDTTGAGDAFFAGTVIGLTYGKNLPASCEIGSRLAASVISITENVCPVSARWNSGWIFPCWTELHPKAPEHSRKRERSGACFCLSEFVDGCCDGHCLQSLHRAVHRKRRCTCHEQTEHCQQSEGHPPHDAEIVGDQPGIQCTVQHKAGSNAHQQAGRRIGPGLRRDHPAQLDILHAHGAHGTVLPGTGGNAHGDAVDDVQQRDAADDGQKTVQHDAYRVIGAAVLPVALPQVLHDDVIRGKVRQREEGVLVGGAVQLHTYHIIVLVACHLSEQRFRCNRVTSSGKVPSEKAPTMVSGTPFTVMTSPICMGLFLL